MAAHLVPLVPPDGIWLQNSSLYHSTIYHASTHLVGRGGGWGGGWRACLQAHHLAA